MGFPIEAIVADNGPEYRATAFTDALAAKTWRASRSRPGHRTTTRWLNASKEPRSKNAGPAFHRLCFTSIRQLQREADAWLTTYNHRRRNHGDYMAGRRPIDLLELTS